MNYSILQRLSGKLYFSVEDLVDILGIKPESAWVLCSRYTRDGVFVRVKNNFYILAKDWEKFAREDFLRVSNFLQVPSYISFMTALSFYEITTQVTRNFFECASLKRSLRLGVRGAVFNFYKLKKQYYFDFVKREQFFIATKEKAFIDSVYLYSFGKYKLDFSSLDLTKLDRDRIKKVLGIYPEKTRLITERLCKI